jgi:RNA methyltransferase, TrmH family
MLSKAFEKYVNSLRTKKGRREHNVYVLEGEKSVLELVDSGQVFRKLVATEEWLGENPKRLGRNTSEAMIVSIREMKKLSSLQTPSALLAIADIPDHKLPDKISDLALALDGLQDPGNLGTIIRTADWFGIEHIFTSDDTVDAYNPKVVQSAMGSLLRVKLIEKPLQEIFERYSNVPVYAADVNGEDIRKSNLKTPAILLIGNEGSGIKKQWHSFIHQVVSIPRLGKAESLNASVATAILCAWWKMKN